MENQRSFLSELWTKFNIQHPSHWGSISTISIKENKGQSLLRIHGGSLFRALLFAFPGKKNKKDNI